MEEDPGQRTRKDKELRQTGSPWIQKSQFPELSGSLGTWRSYPLDARHERQRACPKGRNQGRGYPLHAARWQLGKLVAVVIPFSKIFCLTAGSNDIFCLRTRYMYYRITATSRAPERFAGCSRTRVTLMVDTRRNNLSLFLATEAVWIGPERVLVPVRAKWCLDALFPSLVGTKLPMSRP